LWSSRRNSGIGDLLGKFRQGLKDIHHKLAPDTNGACASFKKDRGGFFASRGEFVGHSVLSETASLHRKFDSLDLSTTVDMSTACVRSLLYGDGLVQTIEDNASIGQVLDK
jgi:hypothetical protein